MQIVNATPTQQQAMRMDEYELFAIKDYLESNTVEFLKGIADRKFIARKRSFYRLFTENNVSIADFPRLAQAFDFAKFVSENLEGR